MYIQLRKTGGCIELFLCYMRSQPEDSSWDLSPVINLIYSLSYNDVSSAKNVILGPPTDDPLVIGLHDEDHSPAALGNFDKLWNYLGQPLDVPPPIVKPGLPVVQGESPDGHWFDPKGSDSEPSALKGVRWRDEFDGADLEDNDGLGTESVATPLSKQEKKSAKRKRQKELAARLKQEQDVHILESKLLSSNGSDDEVQQQQLSSATKASKHHTLRATTDSDGALIFDYSSSPPTSTPPKHSVHATKGIWPISSHFSPQTLFHSPKPQIEPLRLLSAAEKKAKLTKSLIAKFESERKYLLNHSVPQDINDGNHSFTNGIHVFVDASNIMIGFHETLKRARGIPTTSYIRGVPFSFHSLALIMERNRPTAKRVLVGSTPSIPAFEEAKQMGYETSILDKVHKAKELTARQKKYHNQHHQQNGNGGYGTSGQSSGSETTTAVFAPEKWVEQAVDEILHLKILESLVDAKAPSTIVLATGDAAEAEYSGGFLRMVERALEKGWSIELVSFTQSISFAYRKKEFRQKWGKKFRIIELDEFSEELLAL
ncbi:MAG: hypothetical protein M1827_000020 [Pycnora praestabilis]|nr:MAG: hypothetical protein M1827_000020 [Pycnora praestabilis]